MPSTVSGATLTEPDWLAARIAEMGRAWGTTQPRIAGTLWWCMVASALVEQIARAYAHREPVPEPTLDRLDCEIRGDGGIERVHIMPPVRTPAAAADSTPTGSTSATALRETLAAVIAPVAAVSGAGVPALWAIAADAIGNRALDAGAPEAGARLAQEIGGKLPVPRFVQIGGRTFVRRISCCLVFEVPSCQMCTSCPKRPAAERKAMLANLAGES
ncbi:(2Fe-2S)-binding protein [Nocardia australiensis]|uniref:(2Fe-2S)-binding protein n=1 Tax=Nocardia australiensis TaxID=2887191 RepID=UPI001D156B14|nr:(2Fe-2S)-binding protein [Nocardia australiensis]